MVSSSESPAGKQVLFSEEVEGYCRCGLMNMLTKMLMWGGNKHTSKLTHKAVMNKTESFKLNKLSKVKAILLDLL